jgi:hypothetical protein
VPPPAAARAGTVLGARGAALAVGTVPGGRPRDRRRCGRLVRGKEEYSSRRREDRDRECPEATLVLPQHARDDRHIEWPIEHRDVTTIMALLGDIAENVRAIRACWRKKMGKKRKVPKLTREDHARHARIQEMVRERIAYHEAKAREEEETRRRAAG